MSGKVVYSAPPAVERIADRWRTCFHTLFPHKIESILAIAKNITVFHAEYNANPLIWEANWRVVCKQIVGLTYGACSQYEKVHEVFSSPMLDGYQDKLPPKTYILYLIARAYQVDERTVLISLDNGTITRAMSEAEAKQLLQLAQDDAGLVEANFSLFPDEEPPTRAKPKTYPTYKREGPDLNVSDNLGDAFADVGEASAGMEDAEEESEGASDVADAEEVEDESPVFRDYPLYGLLIQDAGSNKESAICRMTVHNDIKVSGGEVEEAALRLILTARANYPAFFRVMAEWDNRFQAIPVTMALRELGYK